MPFAKNGFLGGEATAFAEELKKRHPGWYSLALSLSQYANDLLPRMKVFNKDGQRVACAVLFMRVLQSFSAAIRLLEFGLRSDAEGAARSALEGAFKIKVCGDEDSGHEDYFKTSLTDQLKWANVLLERHRKTPGSHVDETQLINRKSELEEQIVTFKAKPIRVEDWASRAKLETEYEVLYRLLCIGPHVLVQNVTSFGEFDAENNLTALKWGPDFTDVELAFHSACVSLLVALDSASKVFDLPAQPVADLHTKLAQIMSQANE